MASTTPVFTLLCCAQTVIGLLMFVFGIVDRCAVQLQPSFLMLPIWIGLLVGFAGFSGLIVGRQNKQHGSVDVNAVSAIRAANITCIGLSFLAFFLYGQVLSYIGLLLAMNDASFVYYPPSTASPIPKLPHPADNYTDNDAIQGVLSVIMILSLLEMFVGAWLALLEKEQMVFGTPPRQDRRPLLANEAAQPQSVQQTVAVQRPQQQAYVVAQGSNLPVLPSNQVYVPSNQQQQQPQYVLVQPSAAMATNQPYIVQQQQQQPQYVNPLPASNWMPSNPSMVPSNINMVSAGNTNMMPSNPSMAPSNHSMVPSNPSMVPSNQQVTPSGQHPRSEAMSSQQEPRNLHIQQNDESGPTNLQVEGGEINLNDRKPERNKLV